MNGLGLESNIAAELTGAVLTIRFERPAKKNALTLGMYTRIVALLSEARQDRGVSAVVITGSGTAFTAGNDLADFLGSPPLDDSHPVLQFLTLLVDFEKPLIAAVNGIAIGVGATMLLHCDLVIAAVSARFAFPFVTLGIVPEAASSVILPRIAGVALASELLLLGETFDAGVAKDARIVSEVVRDADLAERAMSRAAAFAAKAPQALAAAKNLIRAPFRAELHAAIRREGDVFRERLVSAEAKEAITAVVEKRPPVFQRP